MATKKKAAQKPAVVETPGKLAPLPERGKHLEIDPATNELVAVDDTDRGSLSLAEVVLLIVAVAVVVLAVKVF